MKKSTKLFWQSWGAAIIGGSLYYLINGGNLLPVIGMAGMPIHFLLLMFEVMEKYIDET